MLFTLPQLDGEGLQLVNLSTKRHGCSAKRVSVWVHVGKLLQLTFDELIHSPRFDSCKGGGGG
ncbi:hypothetical protein D3C80_2107760 [compost metagenome]